MKAKVLRPFATVNKRYVEGDKVTIEEVGENLFYACTDAEKPRESHAREPEVTTTKKKKPD